jgi:putative chitinase
MLTTDQLRAIMPQLPAAKSATLFPFLSAAITEFSIDRPARTAAFLAQLAHESGQFRFMEEIWGPTAAQKRYEPPSELATTLGNTQAGDGKRFKGRGPIQVTGRSNYRRFGDLLGLDLIADPPRAALPEVAFRIAGLFWSKKGLNELADQVSPDAFREITRRINGGFHGLAEREQFYETAKSVLEVTGPAVSRGAPRAPIDLEEPVFDRGHEAIRSAAPPSAPPPEVRKRAAKKAATKGRAKKAGAKKAGAKRAGAKKSAARKATAKRSSSRTTTAKRSARKARAKTGSRKRRSAKRR